MLLHLQDDVLNYGPPVGFSTERLDCMVVIYYNYNKLQHCVLICQYNFINHTLFHLDLRHLIL